MSPVSSMRQGAITVITVDNPPVNALSQAVRAGLLESVEAAEADGDCAALVVLCAGRTFIAGADIREFGKPPLEPFLPDLIARIEACEKPVVAAIHGTALGGGYELAMGCHYRIAAPSAAVGLPEVNLGLLPGATGTQRLPRLVGAERALDMMLSGKPVKAPTAREWGAIDRVTADGEDLSDAAVAYAGACIDAGPRRVRDMDVPPTDAGVFDAMRKSIAGKTRGLVSPGEIIDCVELSTRVGFDEAVAAEREAFLRCMASPQSRGLRHAFFAERAVAKVPGIGKETPRRSLARAAVIGAGTMGAGIAYNCLASGLEVTLMDNSEEGLLRGADTIRGLFRGGVDRGKLSEADAAAGLGRFRASQDYRDIADADIVVEAVFESMAVKKEVFAAIDAAVKPGAVLASNTSTLSIDEIAAATARPRDVIGLHFFSPAHIMRLLEIVRGSETADEVIATSLDFARRLGKIGVLVGNCFGFVGNRMLYSYGREAQLLLLEGATPATVDKALYDWGMAMGPLAVGDLAGLDVGYKTRRERPDPPDDPRFYRVADVLVEMGRYGRKTGKGYYIYEAGSRAPAPDPEVETIIRAEAAKLGIEGHEIGDTEIVERCVYGLIVEGTRILEDGIAARASDIDVVWINGYGFPRHRGGPMRYADEVGIDKVYAAVRDFCDRFGPQYWEPPALLKALAGSGKTFADWDAGWRP